MTKEKQTFTAIQQLLINSNVFCSEINSLQKQLLGITP
jgi:hypothetical protein